MKLFRRSLCVLMTLVIMFTGLAISSFAAAKTETTLLNDIGAAGDADAITASSSKSRWNGGTNSYIYKTESGYTVVDCAKEDVNVTVYDSAFKKVSARTVTKELPLFGGFYSGSEYNYMLFGQKNSSENNSAEVMRLVRYKKNFDRVASGSVSNCYTIEPFHSGNVYIAENGGKIMIHTSRLRYASNGVNHQSQLTVIMDYATLQVENDLGAFQENHVSHSFNQYVKADGDKFVLVDHGDAYPRSVLLTEYSATEGKYLKEYTLKKIPGETGANCTGVTVGGLEISPSSYLVPINSIDHSKVSSYTSFEMKGLDKDERNIILLVKTKDDSSEARAVTLTDYIGKGLLGSTPKIVKISDSKFAVLWQEFTYDGKDKGLRFVMVDDAGNRVGDIQTADAVLSRDCDPVLNGDNLVWYVNEGENSRRFYKVSLSASADTNAQDSYITYADKTVNIKVGETVTPSLSHSTGGVEFSSSDTAVATVSGQGAISGVAPGTATVTAALSGTQLKSTVTVNVTSASSSGNQTNQPDTAGTSSTLYMIISAIISIINFIIRFISSLSAA